MKNKPFLERLGFAWNGIRAAWKTEASFRVQVLLGAGMLVFMGFLRPSPLWWALILLTMGGVLAAELFNTALEYIVDRLHPKQHPLIAKAKDCAAGAVLLLSLTSAVIFCLLVLDHFLNGPRP
jgi:diacylglycerol kinase (ATP)